MINRNNQSRNTYIIENLKDIAPGEKEKVLSTTTPILRESQSAFLGNFTVFFSCIF